MDRYPKGGLIGKIHQAVTYVAGLKIPVYAANAGYFIVLSLFPTLVLLLGLLRYTGLQVETLTGFLEGFIPAALMPSAKKLILSTYQNTSGAVISISALTALWSASRGVYGLLTGLNSVYQVPEDRVFVMGDHRSVSVDSRNTTVGCVAEEQIVGKIVFRVWPISEVGAVY